MDCAYRQGAIPPGPTVAASFDADEVLWATVFDPNGTNCHLVTIDLVTGVVTDVGLTDDYLDALAWGPPP